MGARGPAPKPTVLKILQGNPGGKALNKREPKPQEVPEQCPEPPERMKPIAKEEWRRSWQQLKACGLLATVDLTLFEIYCDLWADYVEFFEKTKKLGTEIVFRTEKTNKNKERVNSVGQAPWLLSKFRTVDNIIKLADRFGMSPAARSRIQMFEEQEQKDDLRKRLMG